MGNLHTLQKIFSLVYGGRYQVEESEYHKLMLTRTHPVMFRTSHAHVSGCGLILVSLTTLAGLGTFYLLKRVYDHTAPLLN